MKIYKENKIKVYVEKTDEYKEVSLKPLKEIMKELKINPTTVIITKNNELITDEAKITEKDEIKFLSVISGG
jgi:sulfur carrier protein